MIVMFFDVLLVVLGLFLLPLNKPLLSGYTHSCGHANEPLAGIFVMTQILPNHANRIPTNPPETSDVT